MKKKKKLTFIIITLVFCAGLAGLIFFGVRLGVNLFNEHQNQSFANNLLDGLEVRPTLVSEPIQDSLQEDSTLETTPEIINYANEYLCEYTESIEDDVEIEDTWIPFVDFTLLNERLPGVIGWLQMGDTALSHPIMQWTDNDFFLYHLPDGTRNRNGAVFLDYRNSYDFTDRNTLIYGHMTRSDSMFGLLRYFRYQDFFEANQTMYIYTPYRDYRLYIFTAYLVDSGFEAPTKHFDTDEEFMEYVADITARSFFESSVVVEPGDRIVSLCTCAYDFPNARLIVVGKLVQI